MAKNKNLPIKVDFRMIKNFVRPLQNFIRSIKPVLRRVTNQILPTKVEFRTMVWVFLQLLLES